MEIKHIVLSVLLSTMLLIVGVIPAFSEEITEIFSHNLELNASSRSFEHRISLPGKWAAQGKYFTSRSLKIEGDLVIQKEQLLANGYYVKCRLVSSSERPPQGSLTVTLHVSSTPDLTTALEACLTLKVIPDRLPRFYWSGGEAEVTALRLTDLDRNRIVWERLLVGKHCTIMDETVIESGHRYMISAWQVNSNGRLSAPTHRIFQWQEPERKMARTIFRGMIHSIHPATENDPPSLQGIITVTTEEVQRSFLVSKYTLILVEDGGYAYAAELRQLKPGWKCDVAYDIHDSDRWNTDPLRRPSRPDSELIYADNLYVVYPVHGLRETP